jgi:stearoyl-CoA desaturase (Delta-9 desaturase)
VSTASGALGSGAARRGAEVDDRREAAYHLIAVTLPVAGVAVAIVLLWNRAVSARDLAILLVGYLATGCGITAGYHRLLTHRAFKTGPRLRFLFAYLGALAFEGPPIRWVADHRKHHAFADVDGDPHSPHLHHGEGWRGALEGLWHAHVGWLFKRSAGADPLRYASDLMSEPAMRWISRNYGLVVLSGLLIPALVGFALGHTLAAAATAALWGGLVRMFLVHHMTWSVNSLGHYFGKRRFAIDDESRNLGLIAVPSLGDSYHHNHHAFPTSARHGLTAREVDLSWQLLRVLRRLGLVWDCVEFPPERIAAKEGP